MCCGIDSYAQDEGYDVFIPIAKYIRQGDAEKLAAWFDDNLEISVISNTSDSSKNQARQILKAFFDSYTPRGFEITHTAGRSNMKYAVGRRGRDVRGHDLRQLQAGHLQDSAVEDSQRKIKKTSGP